MKYYDRTLLWKMIYNGKLWQSINETNQESKYLQLCRAKAYCQFRIHCLLEAVCYLTFQLYKTLGGYCTSTSSQVRTTTEHDNAQNLGYLSKTFLVCFIDVAMQPKCCNAAKMLQSSQSFPVQWLCEMTPAVRPTCCFGLHLIALYCFLLYESWQTLQCLLSESVIASVVLVKLIAFCPWYAIEWLHTWINKIITQ